MWGKITTYLKGHPERLSVVKFLIENGFSIKESKIYCNNVEIPPIRIARIIGKDRRTVTDTVKMIMKNTELRDIFILIRSAGLSLRELAKYFDLGVVEITSQDPRSAGILAEAAALIAREGLSIRQALVEDPEFSPEPKLTLITEKKLPGKLISNLLKIKGVAKVSIY